MNWPVNPLRGNQTKPLTGEPCAGNPPARFGGGRGRNQSVLPTPINAFLSCQGNTCLVKLGQDLWKPVSRRPVFRRLILLDRDASMSQALSAIAGSGRFRASARQSGWGVVLLARCIGVMVPTCLRSDLDPDDAGSQGGCRGQEISVLAGAGLRGRIPVESGGSADRGQGLRVGGAGQLAA